RARAILENLQSSRGIDKNKKTLSQHQIESLLDKYCRIYGESELNKLRDQAKQLKKILKLEKEWNALNKIVGSLLDSQSEKNVGSDIARARAAGKPYDLDRIELFTSLTAKLKSELLPRINKILS